jgi:exosortase A-associated hydrolase 1
MASVSPITFKCNGKKLYGMLHNVTHPYSTTGILIVVGGPQYRIGSHRQFVLFSRDAAQNGIPVFRFDYHGMGDSDGEMDTFENIEDDIKAAINAFMLHMPNIKEIVIWGLCDAASAAIFYAYKDERVKGLVLLNPWVRTQEGEARSYLYHYYIKHAFDINTWRRIIKGEFSFIKSINDFYHTILSSLGLIKNIGSDQSRCSIKNGGSNKKGIPLPDYMLECIERFDGNVLFILSGDDLIAAEFKDVVKANRGWKKLFLRASVKKFELSDANHTFSRKEWRDQVSKRTIDWIKSW